MGFLGLVNLLCITLSVNTDLEEHEKQTRQVWLTYILALSCFKGTVPVKQTFKLTYLGKEKKKKG